MELDRIYCIDVLEGLKQLEDNSIDVIITSPPYNKCGLNGSHNKNDDNDLWNKTIAYGGNFNNDNKNEEEYQQWQIEILNECYRVLKNDGVMFYNHKNRIVKGKGYIISPYQWLTQTPFMIRQEIVWNQGGGANVEPSRFVPVSERIFFLTKTKKHIFNRNKDVDFKTDVWNVKSDKNTEHPAPFPITIPDTLLKCITRKGTVLDIFMGSGTTAIASLNNGFNYLGFELFQEYVDMAEKRIEGLFNS